MAKDLPIQFKGTSLKIIQTQLRTTDPATLHAALAELTGNRPDFSENELALLDFSNADLPGSVDWAQIRDLLRHPGLTAVATHGLPEALAATAATAGLPAAAADALSRAPRARAPEPPPTAEPPALATPEPAPRTVILDKPLRSGQRFYARGCDLVVTAMISAGAEVIADGNIHVYAPCAAVPSPAPAATARRAYSPPAWKPNWFPWPASTAPSRPAFPTNGCTNRPPFARSRTATNFA